MQKLQESVFSILKTTSLSPAVFSFLQPTEDFSEKTLPLGGILRDTKYGWLALGPKFCVVDLRSGLKVAARTFGSGVSNCINVTSVVEIPTPLTDNTQQLIISLEYDRIHGLICVFHINGSQLLRCIKTDVVITDLAVCDGVPSGPLICFDGFVMAGTCHGDILVFDLNRSALIQALKHISQGCENLVRNEENPASLILLPTHAMHKLEGRRELVENDKHLGLLLNEDSFMEEQYIFRNPDGTVRMKANQSHIRVTVLQYIPQLGSVAVGFNFGAFQIWNMLNLKLEFTSQVNVECLPVTHFGFQEPCDDPRAFCYLWVVFSVIDRFEEEEFPMAVMYSLTYQGKGMLTETKSLYQEFLTATVRFQVELCAMEDISQFMGGRCISCHTYSISSTLGEEGEDTMLNLCQLVWECWGETAACTTQYCMLLFDLDQWYKDQMPETYQLESNAFMSTARCPEISRGTCLTLDLRLDPASVAPYSHATRLEEHFYPNSLQYSCVCLNTSEASTVHTVGVQRQILRSMGASGPSCLLSPARLHAACRAAGLAPLYCDAHAPYAPTPEEQRHFLLSVALEARLSRFLKRCAHDWATGTHSGVGCTLTFLVDWSWKRAIELKENAKELTAPLFTSSTLPDRNVIRCLEHCVQQLTALTGLLDAVLTKCCNLVVPDALSEMEEKYKGIGTVSLYFQVVQWFVRVGLLPERMHSYSGLPYPAAQLYATYKKRRMKLHRLQDKSDEESANKSCPLLYIDQLIEHEFGGERVHSMWVKGGSECGGLYPPPSLYALLRLYLLPDIALEHKHSLLLYLLLDYSMLYDEMRYEAVIRRLMQFPTMFGLSNTAIKATQAFWHLDHRDFDFALDQLQCLTGNTLSDWQHHVVLSALLAQKKTQAALQYLHVKKPPPIQNVKDGENIVNDNDKLEDWQSCCNLYLARGLVFEALDVIRMCVNNAASVEDKAHLLNFFYRGCRNTGQLSKILQVTLLPFEEEVFIKYLQDCNESQTSELLIMYYLQQARYLEAEQYNSKIKSRGRSRDMATSTESILDVLDREGARVTLVEVVCSSLPTIATSVARCALTDFEPHIIKPKPMSVYVQALSPKNKFTYKSSFIQDTIENASETWINKPKMRKGLKRALSIQETPFICTPKSYKSRSLLTSEQRGSEATPPKRAKLDLSGTPRTPKMSVSLKVSDALSQQMASLLDMPEVQTPQKYYDRSGAETPQSILKNRRVGDRDRDAPSPADSRCLCESDDEELETASNHTHCSDCTNKHLRFTIPTASEAGSTPSPVAIPVRQELKESPEKESEKDSYSENRKSSRVSETHPLESPPKKFAAEGVKSRKSYKDTVRARRSLSISANSSLSEDPSTSIESIADIPIMLINPRYSGEKKRHSFTENTEQNETEIESEIKRDLRQEKDVEMAEDERKTERMELSTEALMPRTPKSRRSIRSAIGESTPLFSSSHLTTPERLDSPTVTPLRPSRVTRRSRTPELSPRSSPLAPILEQPKQEIESEPHPKATTLSVPRQLRSRSRTPERSEKLFKESSRLEAITESPTKSAEVPPVSPSHGLRSRSRTPELSSIPDQPATSPRSLRSRSRTPELEIISDQPPVLTSPRSVRSRSKTPEKLMSPKKEHASRSKKSLTRIVLEANTFAKTKKQLEIMETETIEEKTDSIIECTPMKSSKEIPTLMDINFSPITNKSILQSSSESLLSVSTEKDAKSNEDNTSEIKTLPAFTTINETYIEKSVLLSYESSIAETSSILIEQKVEIVTVPQSDIKLTAISTESSEVGFGKSILESAESSVADTSNQDRDTSLHIKEFEQPQKISFKLSETALDKSVLASCDSSVAESDDSVNRVNRSLGKSFNDGSSIMTSDSEVDTKDNWKSQLETQARVIQKEKESIVEIEREINEIEGEMSDDCRVESDSGEGEVEEEEEEIEEEDNESNESEEEEESGTESNDEVISIADSDESSESSVLQIDEQPIEEPEKIEQVPKELQEMEVVSIPAADKEVAHLEEFKKTTEDNEITVTPELITDGNISNPLDQAYMSLLTDDNSAIESDRSVNLNYSDEHKVEEDNKKDNDNMTMDIDQPDYVELMTNDVPFVAIIETKLEKPNDVKDADIVDVGVPDDKPKDDTMSIETIMETETSDKEDKPIKIDETVKKTEIASKMQTEFTTSNESKVETEQKGEPKTPATRRRAQSTPAIKFESESEEKTSGDKEVSTPSFRRRAKTLTSPEAKVALTRLTSQELSKLRANVSMIIEDNVLVPRRRSTRSRSKKDDDNVGISDASAKTSGSKMIVDGVATVTDDNVLTPRRRSTRSRSKKDDDVSVASDALIKPTTNKMSVDEVSGITDGDILTPRRRSTRSRSKKDDDNVTADEVSGITDGDVLTPRRRSTRSRSKKDDDNVSVASDASVKSTRSKASEDAGDIKGTGRKRRQSILKPELTVIPEVATDESKGETVEDIVKDYSNARRLTRHQKAVLDSLLESKSPRTPRRRVSTASRSEVTDEDISSTNSPVDERSLDAEEMQTSPDSSVVKPRARLARAASETKASPKPVRATRRVSVDIGPAAEPGGTPSPGRARRASFARACEAIHTPKGRRASTDLKKAETAAASSPASDAETTVTPGRRGRRASNAK